MWRETLLLELKQTGWQFHGAVRRSGGSPPAAEKHRGALPASFDSSFDSCPLQGLIALRIDCWT
jgi:hypothetical protein